MKESKVKHTRFNLWVWHNLPQCSEMVKSITASMDSKLSWREWIKLKIHLLSCDPCINFIKQLKFIRAALLRSDAHLQTEDPKIKLSEDARARIKNVLASSQAE